MKDTFLPKVANQITKTSSNDMLIIFLIGSDPKNFDFTCKMIEGDAKIGTKATIKPSNNKVKIGTYLKKQVKVFVEFDRSDNSFNLKTITFVCPGNRIVVILL